MSLQILSTLAEAEARLRREGLPVNEWTQFRTLTSANVIVLQAELGANVEQVFPALFASDYGSTSPQAWRGGTFGGRRFVVAPGAAAEWGPFGWLSFKQPAEWSPDRATNPAALEAVFSSPAPQVVASGVEPVAQAVASARSVVARPGLVVAGLLLVAVLAWRRS